MSEASGAHGGIGDEILKWSAAVALFSLALRSAYSILSVIIGKFIASFVWLKEVIMRIGPDLIASIAGIMAVNPVLGVIYGAIVSIGLAIAGWNILKVVGDFDVAGLKIKDWFALAGTYLNEFAVKVEKFFLTDFSTHVKNGFEKAREAAKAGWQMLLEGVDWAAEQLKNAAAPKPGGADKKPPTFEWMFGAAGLPPNITKEEKAAALDLKQEEIEKERQLLLLKQQIANSDRTILDMSKSEDVFPGYGPDEPSLGITSTLKQDLALMQKRLDEARDNAKKLYDAETAYAEASYKYRTVLRSWEQRENQTLYEQKIIDAEQFNMKHKAILEAEGHDRIEVLKTELAGIDLVAKAAVDAAKTDEDKKKAWYDSAVKKPSLTNQIIEQERELAFLQADAEKKLDAARGERLAKEKEMLLTSLESTSVTAEEKRAVEERYYAVVDELIQRQRKEMVQLGTSDVQIDRWVKGEKEKSREELIKKEDELTKKKKDKLDAEVSALKDIVNQESLTADRRKAVNEQYLQKRIEQINQEAEERKNKGMDAVTLSQWVAAKTEEAQREALKVSGSAWDGFLSKWEEARSQLSRPFDTGAKLFESLKRGIDNAADALAEFTMTGKMSFTDFANSVVKDILKIMYQSLLTKAILGESGGGGGILSWITSFFGGGGTGGPTTGDYGVETYAGIGHTGGIVGEASWPVRAMPSAVYHMAPRLHSGLAADEFPAILQRGETVIPKGRGPAGTSTINSSITVNVNGGSGPGSWSGAGPYAGGSDPKVLGREIALVVKAEFDKHLGECIRPGGQLNRKGITA
jgi:hypothetical protein